MELEEVPNGIFWERIKLVGYEQMKVNRPTALMKKKQYETTLFGRAVTIITKVALSYSETQITDTQDPTIAIKIRLWNKKESRLEVREFYFTIYFTISLILF